MSGFTHIALLPPRPLVLVVVSALIMLWHVKLSMTRWFTQQTCWSESVSKSILPPTNFCLLPRSSQTGCCSMMSVPSTQWVSAAHESLPAWKTPTSSASTPAKSRMGEQVHRYIHTQISLTAVARCGQYLKKKKEKNQLKMNRMCCLFKQLSTTKLLCTTLCFFSVK